MSFIKLFSLLACALTLVSCIHVSGAIADSRRDPHAPFVNLNAVLKRDLRPLPPIPLKNGRVLMIYAPPALHLDGERLRVNYDHWIEALAPFGEHGFDADVKLAVFQFARAPARYRMLSWSMGSRKNRPRLDLAILTQADTEDPTLRALCQVAGFEPHEMAHRTLNNLLQGLDNGFEEGLAEYLSITNRPPECVNEDANDGNEAKARMDFRKPELRRSLWRFKSYMMAWRSMREAKKARGKPGSGPGPKQQRMDDYYSAEAGGFLYMADTLGKERLLKLLPELLQRHRKKINAAFFADLNRELGYDIFAVSDADIEAKWGKLKANSVAPSVTTTP